MSTNSYITQQSLKSSKSKGLTASEMKEWIFAFLLFLISGPYFVWERMYIYYFAQILFFSLSLRYLNFNKDDFAIPLCLLFLNLYFIFKMTSSSGIPNLNGIAFVFLRTFSLIPFFFLNKNLWSKIFEKYILIFSITLIPSIIQFLLVTYLNINFPQNIIVECPLNPNRSYDQFWFYVKLPQNLYSMIDFPRFFAYYDEPGVLGNIAMVLLYVEGYNLKRWYNVPIFIAGILSFSLLFYVATLIYILLFSSLKNKIVVIVLVALLITYAYNNEILYNYVFKRFEIVDGEWTGDNRENYNFKYWFSQVNLEDYFFMGYPLGKKVIYAATYKWAMVLFGVIPCLLYISLLIVRASKKIGLRKEFVVYLLIPLMIWFQRPFVHIPLYVFLMVVPVYSLINNLKKNIYLR